jgi:hypothetical protein
VTFDLFTFINGDGADYAEYLKQISEKKLSGKHKINWKFVESLNVTRFPDGFECVGQAGGEGEHNAMKHALAIHEALNHIESDYILLTDVDVAIVYDGWDDVIIKKLNQYDCFGGAYAEGKSKYVKTRYKEFPKANFFAFRRDVLDKVELDFRPFYGKKFKGQVKKAHAKIFNLKERSKFTFDIGWRLPLIFKKNELTFDYMPCYFQMSKLCQLPYSNIWHKHFCRKRAITMEEWHYNGKLFATHKKYARHDKLDSMLGLAWKERVDLYMKGEKNENSKRFDRN